MGNVQHYIVIMNQPLSQVFKKTLDGGKLLASRSDSFNPGKDSLILVV
jgi:hypothetical protein